MIYHLRVPDEEAGSSPRQPIDAILDITKVGHDPSVGDPKRMYNTPTDVDAVLLKTLCPKGVTQAVREQLLEAAPDILQAPGKLPAGSSTTDAAAIADSLANAFEQIANVQAVKSGLIVPRNTEFRNPNQNYLNDKTLRTLEDLETASEEDFTLVVSLNEYILRGDAVGTSCTYVDLRV
jgi:hypothetical protein